uniref:Uncharacterized protein n=1 Tax=Spongospora subterranea TaxID=70186 RepID=A0A0H5QSL0_9EUKA|eukprot:CRZ04662.1 hypothetical protein [Spongospora subterranea]
MLIYFFHHLNLGNSNLSLSARALVLKPSTLKDWVNKSLRCKVSPCFPSLKSETVVQSIVLQHFAPGFLLEFVEDAFTPVNRSNEMNRWIADGFRKVLSGSVLSGSYLISETP